jgi:hypothetical protein
MIPAVVVYVTIERMLLVPGMPYMLRYIVRQAACSREGGKYDFSSTLVTGTLPVGVDS